MPEDGNLIAIVEMLEGNISNPENLDFFSSLVSDLLSIYSLSGACAFQIGFRNFWPRRLVIGLVLSSPECLSMYCTFTLLSSLFICRNESEKRAGAGRGNWGSEVDATVIQ